MSLKDEWQDFMAQARSECRTGEPEATLRTAKFEEFVLSKLELLQQGFSELSARTSSLMPMDAGRAIREQQMAESLEMVARPAPPAK